MKKNIIIIIISAFVAGIILTVASYQTYTIYQLRSQITNDHATLTQVVDFLNQNIQAAQKGSTAQPQSQASSASTGSAASTATKK